MCGIFGWIISKDANISNDKYRKGLEELLLLSETRGKEASGICCINHKEVQVYKKCVRAKELIHTKEFKNALEHTTAERGHMVMGHARMVTNGSKDDNENNQPVILNDLICIHNGIIVNDKEIWENNPDMVRNAEVDTEAFLALMEKNNYQNNLLEAFKKFLDAIEGSLSIALIDRTSNYLLLYTNVGSLYTVASKDGEMLLFASEQYILEKAIKKEKLDTWFKIESVRQIVPKSGMIINIENCEIHPLCLAEEGEKIVKQSQERRLVKLFADNADKESKCMSKMLYQSRYSRVEKLLHVDTSQINKLKRCSRCLLPETFPGIQFDENGV